MPDSLVSIRTALASAFLGDTSVARSLFSDPATFDARLTSLLHGLGQDVDAPLFNAITSANLASIMSILDYSSQSSREDLLRLIINDLVLNHKFRRSVPDPSHVRVFTTDAYTNDSAYPALVIGGKSVTYSAAPVGSSDTYLDTLYYGDKSGFVYSSDPSDPTSRNTAVGSRLIRIREQPSILSVSDAGQLKFSSSHALLPFSSLDVPHNRLALSWSPSLSSVVIHASGVAPNTGIARLALILPFKDDFRPSQALSTLLDSDELVTSFYLDSSFSLMSSCSLLICDYQLNNFISINLSSISEFMSGIKSIKVRARRSGHFTNPWFVDFWVDQK